MNPTRLLLIGPRLTEDLLFWEQLGRALSRTAAQPAVLFHTAGEVTARILEGDGLSVEEAMSAAMDALSVALRTENRTACSALTEASVSAVGFLGSDRKLAVADPDGTWRVRRDLLDGMARAGTVPLVALSPGPTSGLGAVPLAWKLAGHDSFTVEIVLPGTISGAISPEDVMNLAGFSVPAEARTIPDVSLRVLGISTVGTEGPNRGVALFG